MGRGLKLIGFDGVSAFRDRHGKTRYRFRRKGSRTIYLPGIPGSPEFAEAYRLAVEGVTSRIVVGASRTVPGTINALAVAIYASAEWAQLAPTTQSTYRGIIERIRTDYGALSVRGFQSDHVRKMRDKRKATPSAANNLLKVLRWMMNFAVERNLRPDNPVIGIKALKIDSDGFHTWSENEIEAFEAKWPVGTRQRLAMDLLLYTAQRSGDVRQMGRQHVRDGRVAVVQEKTGARLEIPVHPALAASLATVPGGQLMLVETQFGRPYTAKGFYNWFKAACVDARVGNCCPHGLRKSAATRLADAGCTEAQIMAVTGHATTKEIQRYTRARDQRGLADDAMARIGGTQREQKMANPPDKLANKPLSVLK